MFDFRGGTLIAATITTGLVAGLLYAFACAVMLGLHQADDRTFIDAMQRINVAILNGWFMVCFFGSLILIALAGVLYFRSSGGMIVWWISAALVLYIAVLGITMGINVPLNNELAAAGPIDRIVDPHAVRVHFETAWVRWNIVRAVAATAAFGCLTWALVLSGRISASASN